MAEPQRQPRAPGSGRQTVMHIHRAQMGSPEMVLLTFYILQSRTQNIIVFVPSK